MGVIAFVIASLNLASPLPERFNMSEDTKSHITAIAILFAVAILLGKGIDAGWFNSYAAKCPAGMKSGFSNGQLICMDP